MTVTYLHPDDQADHLRLTHPAALAASARWYATALNHPVFPLTPGAKTPLPGSRGFKDATTDLEQVTAWWTTTPQANIGLPTGGRWDVVDIDGHPGWLALVRAPNHLLEQLTAARVANVRTPRGAHWYMPASGNGNRANMLTHVDYRGHGGYVVAPPSRIGGQVYRWIDPPAVGA